MAAPLIAVVNHEPVFMRLMSTIITTSGYEALTIADGGTAYEVLKRDQPQVIIVDTWLADRHAGLDLLQLLKLDAETARIPVIIVSSDDPKSIRERFAEKPADGVTLLFKPFDPEELLEAIKSALERYHA